MKFSPPTPEPSPPRIAVIGSRNLPANYGGVETACENLYTRLAAKKFRVVAYCRSEDWALHRTSYGGVTVIGFPMPNLPGISTFLHCFIATLLATFSKAEILHFHAQGPALFSLIPRLLTPKRKIVFTCHGRDWQRPRWGRFAKWVIRLGERCSAFIPDYRIMVSDDLRHYYQSTYAVQANRISNGVDIPEKVGSGQCLARFSLARNGYLLFVGRLVPEKGIEILVEAFNQLKTGLKLVIVGDSPETPDYVNHLKSLAQDNPRVVFTSYLRGRELAEVYSNALAYVSPSLLEGNPITVLEAMSYGLPVLLSDIPPHLEILSLFSPSVSPAALPSFATGSVESCQQALEGLLNMEPCQLETLGQASEKVVQRHFDWEVVASATQAVYLGLMNSSPSARRELAAPLAAPARSAPEKVGVN